MASLGVGPLLAWGLERRASLREALDGFVLLTTAALSLLFLLPHAYLETGLWAFPVALVGFFLPAFAEHSLRVEPAGVSRPVLLLAVAGLLFHCAIDGAALAAAAGESVASPSHGRHDLTLAIVSHRLPVGLFVWSVVSPVAGRRAASAGLLGLMMATGAGFLLGPEILSGAGGDPILAGVVEALLAGGLLHVVFEHRPQSPRAPVSDGWAGGGALVALALFSLIPLAPHPALAQSWETGRRIFVEASPAILIGFSGAGLLSLIPQRSLSRWMRGKTALGSAMRGVVFGLPIPICSCGVVPLYRGLMDKGLPPAAAAAFLIATPELGVDAVAISLPLLGWQMTLVRVVAATVLALCVGLAVAALTPAPDADPSDADPTSDEEERSGLRGALQYGFVESLDELGPWVLAGIALAALLEPLLDPAWIAAVPGVMEIPLFASLAAPFYVCASAATPVGGAFLAKGVSAGAVVAFLLVGPATNVTTYGAVRAFHGRRTTLLVGAVLLGATLGLGVIVNLLAGEAVPVPLSDPNDSAGFAANLSAALFAVLLAASILRQGPRGFLARLGFPGRAHDHDHASSHH